MWSTHLSLSIFEKGLGSLKACIKIGFHHNKGYYIAVQRRVVEVNNILVVSLATNALKPYGDFSVYVVNKM